jgi:uncharacterized membrane protein YkoI
MARANQIAAILAGLLCLPATVLADDEDVTLEELPEPARQTALREVKDGIITDIERETERGATVYEVEFVEKDGKKFELDIGADGTLLRRHRD